jgi:hypothetical protein
MGETLEGASPGGGCHRQFGDHAAGPYHRGDERAAASTSTDASPGEAQRCVIFFTLAESATFFQGKVFKKHSSRRSEQDGVIGAIAGAMHEP